MNYYLPTTLKILNAYDRMGAAGVSGENIDGTMHRIETIMDTIVMAFHKQLDASSGMRPWTSPRTSPSWKPCWPKRGWQATSRTSTEKGLAPWQTNSFPN